MKNIKIILLICIALILNSCVNLGGTGQKQTEAPRATPTSQAKAPQATPTIPTEAPQATSANQTEKPIESENIKANEYILAWVTDQFTDENENPKTNISIILRNLQTGDELVYFLGAYTGPFESYDPAEDDVILAGSLFWGGGGNDFIVKKADDEKLSVMESLLEGGQEAFPYEEILAIPIPAGSIITGAK